MGLLSLEKQENKRNISKTNSLETCKFIRLRKGSLQDLRTAGRRRQEECKQKDYKDWGLQSRFSRQLCPHRRRQRGRGSPRNLTEADGGMGMSSRDGMEPAASGLHLFISIQAGSCPQKSILLSGAAEYHQPQCVCVQVQGKRQRQRDHRITEYLELEETHKDHLIRLLAQHSSTQKPVRIFESIMQTFLKLQHCCPHLLLLCPERIAKSPKAA